MKRPKKEERIECHVSDDDCLLPEWQRKLKAILQESEGEKDDRTRPKKD